MDNVINITGEKRIPKLIPMSGKDSQGNLYEVDNISMLKNGKRFLPVMGEFHYSRWEEDTWEEELLKMKAGGMDAVATYVFWIHHEEKEGEWDFGGCRNLRKFLEVCIQADILVWLRIGPWAHGECRNGGFPDWLVERCGEKLRSNDPVYLEAAKKFYAKIGEQVKGMMISDGGPVLGIQLENEYGHCGGGPSEWDELKEHMLTLKKMAIEEGMIVPYYTSTGWGGGVVIDGETLPVLGGYVDAPWADHVDEMPANGNFVFSPYKQDNNIGSDLKRMDSSRFRFSVWDNPYFTAELGGGMQVTSHRRVYVWPEDIEAQTLTMLGSGANLLGYYMYHGGINPDGKYSTFQESRATGYTNDLPVKSYDFETCIRESGEINKSYGRLRKLHLMLKDFGEMLAGTTTYFAERQPETPEDMETLRVTARVCDDDSGFLFVNNHQRKRQMKERQNASVQLKWPDRELVITDLNLKSGECAVIPFGLKMDNTAGEVVLERTNASLLCHIGERYFFYTDAEPVYIWKEKKGNIITLTADQANRAYRFGNVLYITEHDDSCLIEKAGKVYLISSHEAEHITVYEEQGDPIAMEVYSVPEYVAASVSDISDKGTANVDTGNQECGYREYQIQIADFDVDKIHQLYLEADYVGDRAEIYVDGKLADDWFTTGETWHAALKRFGYPKELVLRIYSTENPIPNPYNNQIYYDLSVEKGCELRSVRMISEYMTEI